MSENYPYYYKTWFIVLMLILFFPVGFILMWKGGKFGKTIRVIISAFGILSLYPFLLRIKKLISSLKESGRADEIEEDINRR